MEVILFEPQIPQNAGNIVRTCAATGCDLTLVGPLGFSINNRWLKRAGLDYWEGVHVTIISDLDAFLDQSPHPFYFFSSKATKRYTEVSYTPKDSLIFGSETKGLPSHYFNKWDKHFLNIPMTPSARCLNLANAAAVVVYEALRQQNFPNVALLDEKKG